MIILHVGKIGVGKSYACTKEIWRNVLNGKDSYIDWEVDFSLVMRKYRKSLIFFWRHLFRKITFSKEPKLGRVFFYENLEDIYGISNGEVYMDEAHRFLNARQWEKIPPNFIKKMSQSRKYNTNLHFITQHQNMIDVNIRRLCNEIVIYKKFARLMYYNSYDGAYIDALDKDPALRPKSSGFRMYWFSKSFAQSYDTYKIFGEKFIEFSGPMLWSYEKYLAHLKVAKDTQKKRREFRDMFPTFLRALDVSKNYLSKKGGDINGKKASDISTANTNQVEKGRQRVYKSDSLQPRRQTGTVRRIHV